LKRLLRYLRGTKDYRLVLGRSEHEQKCDYEKEPSDNVQTSENKENERDNNIRQSRHILSSKFNTPILTGYSDASWGNDYDTRRSYSGYIFYLDDSPISWSAKKQSSVALSTMESEYVALMQACKEAIWLQTLLKELGFEQKLPTTLFEDNQSAVALANNPVFHARSKHIDIQFHYVREKVASKEIALRYVATDDMNADIFTKPLPGPRHAELVKKLKLRR